MADSGKSVNPNALPNYQNAVIAREKLENYVLDPTNLVGRHKAIVFKSSLGFVQSEWELLAKMILHQLPYYEAVVGRKDIFGERYNVTMPITGPNGQTADVVTAWIIDTGKDYPRFVTAIVR